MSARLLVWLYLKKKTTKRDLFQQRSTQPWSSSSSCSTVHIYHTLQYSHRKFLPRKKRARETKNSVQATHAKIVNQPVRAPKTQSSVLSSAGVSEREKSLLRISFERWAGIARVDESITNAFEDNPVLAQQNQRVSLRTLCNRDTQPRHSMNESDETLFEHCHKETRPYTLFLWLKN